ncbi:hypothetical protein C8R41DRAFT_856602 [Lentinula lateritia]|uniref:Uncharacterized protein n=1 Tax=Lentinula lateritia TaxID=40482 RepID=A0ABQ8V0K8_9AGAR|nr:hypothetical protein C8R41DRAFT_856602 [Lentinula lateritia]
MVSLLLFSLFSVLRSLFSILRPLFSLCPFSFHSSSFLPVLLPSVLVSCPMLYITPPLCSLIGPPPLPSPSSFLKILDSSHI